MATFDASRLDPMAFQAKYQKYQDNHPEVVANAKAEYNKEFPDSLETELHGAEQGARAFDAALAQASAAVDAEVEEGFFKSIAQTPDAVRAVYIHQQISKSEELKEQAQDTPPNCSGTLEERRINYDFRFSSPEGLGTDTDGEVDFAALTSLPQLKHDSRDRLGSLVANRNLIAAVYEKAREAVFAEGHQKKGQAGKKGLYQMHCKDHLALTQLEEARRAVVHYFRATFSTPYHEDLTQQEQAVLDKIISDYEAAGGPSGVRIADMSQLLTLLRASLERAKKAQSLEMYVRYKAFVEYANFNQGFASSDKKAGEQAHLKNLVYIAKALGLSDLLDEYQVISKGKYWGENIDRNQLYAMMNFVFSLTGADEDETHDNIFGLDVEAQAHAQQAVDKLIRQFHEGGYISETIFHKGGVLGILAKDLHAEGGHGIFKRREKLRFYGTGELTAGKAIDHVNFKVDSKKIHQEDFVLDALVHSAVNKMVTESGFDSVQITPAPQLLHEVTKAFTCEAEKVAARLFNRKNQTYSQKEAGKAIRQMQGVDARVKGALARAVEHSKLLGREGVNAKFFDGIVGSNEALTLYEPRLKFLLLPCFEKSIVKIVNANDHLAVCQKALEEKGTSADVLGMANFDYETLAQAKLATRANYVKKRAALHQYLDRELVRFHYRGELRKGTIEEKLEALRELALDKDREVQDVRTRRKAIEGQLTELETRGLKADEYTEAFSTSIHTELAAQRAVLVQNFEKVEAELEECQLKIAELNKAHKENRSENASDQHRAQSQVLRLQAQVSTHQADYLEAQKALMAFDARILSLAEDVTQVYDTFFQVTAQLSALVQKAVKGEISYSRNETDFHEAVQGLALKNEALAPALALYLRGRFEQAKAEVVANTIIRIEQDKEQVDEDAARLEELNKVHGLADEHIAAEEQRFQREKKNIGIFQLGHEVKIRNQKAALRHEIRESEAAVKGVKEKLRGKKRRLQAAERMGYDIMHAGVDHHNLDQQRDLASQLRREVLNLESEISEHKENIDALRIQIQQFDRTAHTLKNRTYDRSRREVEEVFDRAMQALIPAKEQALQEAAWLDTQLDLRERDLAHLRSLILNVGEVDLEQASRETKAKFGLEQFSVPARSAAEHSTEASETIAAAPAASDRAQKAKASSVRHHSATVRSKPSSLASRLPTLVDEVQKALREKKELFVDSIRDDQAAIFLALSGHIKDRVAALDPRLFAANARNPIPVELLLINAPKGAVDQLQDDQIAFLIVEAINEIQPRAAVDTVQLEAQKAAYLELKKQGEIAEEGLKLLHVALKEIQKQLDEAGAAEADEAVQELAGARATFDELKAIRDELKTYNLAEMSYYEGLTNTFQEGRAKAKNEKVRIDYVLNNWSKLPKRKPNLEIFDRLSKVVVADDDEGARRVFEELKHVPEGEIVVEGKKQDFIGRQTELEEALKELDQTHQILQSQPVIQELPEKIAAFDALLAKANEFLGGVLPPKAELDDATIQGALTAVLAELRGRILDQVEENKKKYDDEKIGELLSAKAEVGKEAADKVQELENIEQEKRRIQESLKELVKKESRVYELGFGLFGCPLSKVQAAEHFVLPPGIDAVDLVGEDLLSDFARAGAPGRETKFFRKKSRSLQSDAGDPSLGYASSDNDLDVGGSSRRSRYHRQATHLDGSAPAASAHFARSSVNSNEEDEDFVVVEKFSGEPASHWSTWSELVEKQPYKPKKSETLGGLLNNRPWLDPQYGLA